MAAQRKVYDVYDAYFVSTGGPHKPGQPIPMRQVSSYSYSEYEVQFVEMHPITRFIFRHLGLMIDRGRSLRERFAQTA